MRDSDAAVNGDDDAQLDGALGVRAPTRASALATPVQPLLGRPVELVEARDDTCIPPEQLLRSIALLQDLLVPERPDVVDLLLHVGAGELLVDREPVTTGTFSPAACSSVESNTIIEPAGHSTGMAFAFSNSSDGAGSR